MFLIVAVRVLFVFPCASMCFEYVPCFRECFAYVSFLVEWFLSHADAWNCQWCTSKWKDIGLAAPTPTKRTPSFKWAELTCARWEVLKNRLPLAFITSLLLDNVGSQPRWVIRHAHIAKKKKSNGGSDQARCFIVTTELPTLVPPRHIDDLYTIHFTEKFVIRCDHVTKNFAQNMDASTRVLQKTWLFLSPSRYHNLTPSEMRIKTVLTGTRFHFCSRLHR